MEDNGNCKKTIVTTCTDILLRIAGQILLMIIQRKQKHKITNKQKQINSLISV